MRITTKHDHSYFSIAWCFNKVDDHIHKCQAAGYIKSGDTESKDGYSAKLQFNTYTVVFISYKIHIFD